MADQNWVLQAHIHQNTLTNSVQFTNTTSAYATNEAGSTTLMSYGNAPVFRIYYKVQFSYFGYDMNGANFYLHGNYSAGNDYVYDYFNFGNGSMYTGSWSNSNTTYGYNNTYNQMGSTQVGSAFSGYNWGSNVTDIDGNKVASTADRRRAWTTGWLETHFPNQSAYYPWIFHNGMVTDDLNDGSSATSMSKWGGWGIGSGGCSNGPYIGNITIGGNSPQFRGDFFLFRGLVSNNQVNEE